MSEVPGSNDTTSVPGNSSENDDIVKAIWLAALPVFGGVIAIAVSGGRSPRVVFQAKETMNVALTQLVVYLAFGIVTALFSWIPVLGIIVQTLIFLATLAYIVISVIWSMQGAGNIRRGAPSYKFPLNFRLLH